MKNPLNAEFETKFIDEELINLVKKGDFKDIFLQFELGADIEVIETLSGNNLLHIAVIYNKPQLIIPLFKLGINIDHKNFNEASPFELAVCERNFKCAKILFDCGADIRGLKNCLEKNLLTNAHFETQEFLEKFLSVESLKARDACTELKANQQMRLHSAIINNDFDEVKEIVEGGQVNLNFISHQGQNPLCCAIESKSLEIISFFLNPTLRVSMCRSLTAAIKSNKIEIIDELIEFGARLNFHFRKKNVFCYVLDSVKSLEGAKFFLGYFVDKGLDINLKNIDSENVLMYACKNKHGDLIEHLLELGADFNSKSIFDFTAFDIAYSVKDNFAIKKLIENGYRVNQSNVDKIFKYFEESSEGSRIDDFFRLFDTDTKFLILLEALEREHNPILKKIFTIDENKTSEISELIKRLQKQDFSIAKKINVERQIDETMKSNEKIFLQRLSKYYSR